MTNRIRDMVRESASDKLAYRSLPVRSEPGGPSSIDEATRSVEVIGATEDPVEVFDPERWEIVREVLLMDGCEIPRSRQVTLHDTHQRYSTASVLGSFRDMRVAGGQLMGRAHFSAVEEAEGPWTKVREGHITDFSIGYRQIESTWIENGESAVIKGRTFKGPLRVTSRWRPRELSVVPIGADELAKARQAADPPNPVQRNQAKEKNAMNKKLRALLVSRGMPETATDEEAWTFYEQHEAELFNRQAAPAAPAPDAAVVERERIAEITALCRTHQIPTETLDGFVAQGTPVELARARVLEVIASRQVATPAPVIIQGDERDKFRAAAQDGLLLRGAIERARPEKPAPGARELAGWTLLELARRCLVLASVPVPENRMELVGRAMLTGDFPLILANSANKSLFAGWEAAEETWNQWCGTGSVSDFKPHSLPRASETDDLLEVPEHGEFKYGERSEAQEQYQVVTFGRLFAITRQAIINDDLSALSDIPARHGEAAARKIGDVAYAVLTANAAMGDSIALFHANHANLGAAAAVGIAPIAEAIKLMKLQKDLYGKKRLGIRAQFFIAPATIEGAAEVFFNSMQYSTNEASTRQNPYAGSYFRRVYEARLDDSSITAYYFAGPKGKTVNVYFLNGVQRPYLEVQEGWKVDGVEYKVRIDCGAKAVDWRGMVKNAGA